MEIVSGRKTRLIDWMNKTKPARDILCMQGEALWSVWSNVKWLDNDCAAIQGLIPGRGRDLVSLLQNVHTSCWGPHSHGLFPLGWDGRGLKLTACFRVVLRLKVKNGWSCCMYASMGCTWIVMWTASSQMLSEGSWIIKDTKVISPVRHSLWDVERCRSSDLINCCGRYTPCPKKIVPFFYFFSRCPVCGEWCKLHCLLLDTPSFDWNIRRSRGHKMFKIAPTKQQKAFCAVEYTKTTPGAFAFV